MFDAENKHEYKEQPMPASEPADAPEQGTIPVPLSRLLQQYRHHLDALHELTQFLGAAALSDFGEALHALAESVQPSPPIVAATTGQVNADQPARELPEHERPEIQAMIQAVQRNPDAIRKMSNLPEVVLIAAVDRMGTAIRHIPSPSEAVQMAAVQRNPWAIKRIKRPAEAVLAYALEREPELKQHFERLNRSRRGRFASLLEDSEE